MEQFADDPKESNSNLPGYHQVQVGGHPKFPVDDYWWRATCRLRGLCQCESLSGPKILAFILTTDFSFSFQFATITQDLMNNLIGKHALLSQTPLSAPVAALLRTDEGVTDVCYMESSDNPFGHGWLTMNTSNSSSMWRVWRRNARSRSRPQPTSCRMLILRPSKHTPTKVERDFTQSGISLYRIRWDGRLIIWAMKAPKESKNNHIL